MRIRKFARDNRNRMTAEEKTLWNYIRNRRYKGIKFRRQQMIDNYIVDFISFDVRLILEVDGGNHRKAKEYDRIRNEYLEKQGFKVVRFWNSEIKDDMGTVFAKIDKYCTKDTHPV